MLELTARISLVIAFLCAIVITVDIVRHPQKMGIMNIVWPLTALYGSVFTLWGYLSLGRQRAKDSREEKPTKTITGPAERLRPSQILLATSHCGAGCTLGDIVGEFSVFALALKWWGSDLWASFVIDYILAWTLGIVFQYFTIAPMRGLSLFPGIWAAIKADTLSITAWQLGMYGWMLMTHFLIFPQPHLRPNDARYWFIMQLAMIVGFLTASPMNYLLLKVGLKEGM